MTFTFTSLSECDMCGESLPESDERCELCEGEPQYEMVFRHISTNETREITVTLLADNEFLWEKFARSLHNEDPLPYAWLGERSFVDGMLSSPTVDTIEDISHKQMTFNYNGEEDLRELASYEEV